VANLPAVMGRVHHETFNRTWWIKQLVAKGTNQVGSAMLSGSNTSRSRGPLWWVTE